MAVRRPVPLVALAACLLLAAPVPALAYSSGPPDGYAGNPPYGDNCTTCHFSYDPNSGDGSLELLGLPDGYAPGQTYTLQVRLADPGQVRWGFELTVLDDADYLTQGGQLIVTDSENTQISENVEGTEDYLKHTLDGNQWGIPDGPVSWTFDWTAPSDAPGAVTFYFAGNASNGDESFMGDYIYVYSVNVPLGPTATETTTWGRVKALYRP
jgi:hypothetical protein